MPPVCPICREWLLPGALNRTWISSGEPARNQSQAPPKWGVVGLVEVCSNTRNMFQPTRWFHPAPQRHLLGGTILLATTLAWGVFGADGVPGPGSANLQNQ